jgi:hypothetical protein
MLLLSNFRHMSRDESLHIDRRCGRLDKRRHNHMQMQKKEYKNDTRV